MKSVSVVVPTFKRPSLLCQCLEALLSQEFDPSEYEVIIVDDAACDHTRRLVEQYVKRAGLKGGTISYLAVSGTHGPAAARNIGVHAACGEIIAFTDDDCIPSSGWLKAGIMAFDDEVVAVAGQIIVPLPPSPTDYEYNASYLAHSEFVTANCFVRRNALLSIGGFDERFTAAWREDSDLIFTLQERGACCKAAQDAIVVHPVRSAQWGVSIHQQRKNTSHTPSHIFEMIITSSVIPLLAIYWRLRGALEFRVFFI